MKKWLIILTLFFLPGMAAFAQETEQPQEQTGKIPERMREYIQDRLSLSKSEAEKFSPVFLRYFHEFAQIHRENKGDVLVMQQKLIDLRVSYRGEFRKILDEQRANKVFVYEDEFRRKAVDIIRENKRERFEMRPGTGRRFRAMFP